MSEIRAAAERLRRTKYNGGNESDAEVYGGMNSGRDYDEDVIVHAYLAEHDPTPVDESWLRSVGFKHAEGWPDVYTELGCLLTRPEFVDAEGERRWDLYYDNSNWSETIPTRLAPRTRGDLLALCNRLGIPLAGEGE